MSRLLITTALMAEAIPIVDFYRMEKQLKQQHYHLYRTSCDAGLAIDLVVCGMGAKKMKQGFESYLATDSISQPHNWLNFGIAGALSLPIGKLIWANNIAQTSIAVPQGIENDSPITVQSVNKPCADYRPGVLFDMEAQTWLQCIRENAIQFAPEHLFCAKVVSDNSSQYAHKIDKHWVSQAVRNSINELNKNIINII